MADWVTISSLATAGGTLALALATFGSIKSANRSARVAERSLLAGLRPVPIPSREEDRPERVGFGDRVVLTVRSAAQNGHRVLVDLLYGYYEGGHARESRGRGGRANRGRRGRAIPGARRSEIGARTID